MTVPTVFRCIGDAGVIAAAARDYAMDQSADRPMGGENAMPGDGDGQSPAPGLPPASDE